MPEETKGSSREQTLNLRVWAEAPRAIKLLATEEGMTIKQLLFEAVERLYPNWRKKGKS